MATARSFIVVRDSVTEQIEVPAVPTDPTHAAGKAYVDTEIAAIPPTQSFSTLALVGASPPNIVPDTIGDEFINLSSSTQHTVALDAATVSKRLTLTYLSEAAGTNRIDITTGVGVGWAQARLRGEGDTVSLFFDVTSGQWFTLGGSARIS